MQQNFTAHVARYWWLLVVRFAITFGGALAGLAPIQAIAASNDVYNALPQFLVVEYRAISRTRVANTSLYDYVYRIDVRNSGAAASKVTGHVVSLDNRVTILDADVLIGDIPARQTRTSTDTFSVRASAWFDRRLQSSGESNARNGDDDDDDDYRVNCERVFRWTLHANSDTTGPVVSNQLPQGSIRQVAPIISATYVDGGSGVNASGVNLAVDGVNVTARAVVTTAAISYQPSAALAQGVHVVTLSVPDLVNNFTISTWNFVVDTVAPTITGQAPINTTIARPGSTVSANYQDAGAGVDLTQVILRVDGVDVSASTVKTTSGISFTPAGGLANGSHTAILSVADKAGNVATSTWTFGVDGLGPVISTPLPVNGAILAADAMPVISAIYGDTGSGADPATARILVDGVDRTSLSIVSATSIRYTPTQALSEGVHTIRVSVSDRDGNPSQLTWTFTTRTAPQIDTVSPVDVFVATSSPTVTATYHDVGSGIDVTRITLIIDGVNFTSSASITASGLTFKPVLPLTQGQHVITLTVADKAGNVSTSTWRFGTDTVAPVISNQAPNNVPTSAVRPTISAQYGESGTGASGINIASVNLKVDGVDVTAQAQITASQIIYTPTAALAIGSHTVTLSVANNAGTSVSSTWTFAVNPVAPAVTIVSPSSGAVLPADALPTISVTYSDPVSSINPAQVRLELDGVTVTPGQINSISATYTPAQALVEGPHTVKLTVANQAGISSVTNSAFTTATPPVITAVMPAAAFVSGSGTIAIGAQWSDVGSGVAPGTAVLTVDGVNVSAQAQSSAAGISYTASGLADGPHAVSLTVSDRAGNPVTRNWSFTVDSIAPVISNISPANQSLATSARQVISANFADAGAGVDASHVRLLVDGVAVSIGLQSTTAGMQYTPSVDWATGNHAVSLTIYDLAGNSANQSWSFSFGSAPLIYDETPRDISTATQTPRIRVLLSNQSGGIDLTQTRLFVDGVDVSAQAQISATQIIWLAPTLVAEGVHQVRVDTSSLYGMTASKQWQFTIKMPPPPPTPDIPDGVRVAPVINTTIPIVR